MFFLYFLSQDHNMFIFLPSLSFCQSSFKPEFQGMVGTSAEEQLWLYRLKVNFLKIYFKTKYN